MSNSALVSYTKISPNRTSPRTHVIDTITIHHMAGDLTVEKCGEIFQNKARQASSNYGIGTDGRIALYVEEKDRSWCSGSRSNDHRAVTIEVANNNTKTYTISDKAMESLINLCVDICKRNGIPELRWKGDKNLIGKIDKQNMTVHRWFQATACPGDYLYSKMGEIAAEVNARLIGKVIVNPNRPAVPTPTIKEGTKGTKALALQQCLNYFGAKLKEDSSFGPASVKALKDWQKKNGLTPDGSFGPASYKKMRELLK